MKKYIIYKTTNLINNKIYIGLHETIDINDKYLGSGYILIKAIKKYGRNNFTKEILFIFDNKEEMYKKEKELVNEDFIKRQDTYNLILGGGSGLSVISNDVRLSIFEKIRIAKSKLDYKEIAKKRKKTMLDKDINIFLKIGKLSSETQKNNYKNGYINPNIKYTDINIYDSNNIIIFTCKRKDLENLCKINNLPCRSLINSLYNNGIPLFINSIANTKQLIDKGFMQYKNWYALYANEERINLEEYLLFLEYNKLQSHIKRSQSCKFGKTVQTYIKHGGNYKIFNDNNILIYDFIGNKKIELKKLNLPVYTFNNSLKNNKKIQAGKFKDWYMIKY